MSTRLWATRRAASEAAHWHALQRMQALDALQQASFMQWLTASPLHVREYMAVLRVAGELGDALRGMQLDVDALLDGDRRTRAAAASRNVIVLPLPSRLPQPLPQQPRHAPPPGRTDGQRSARVRGWSLGLAAAVCGVAVLTGWAWPRTQTYATAHGEQRRVQLADRSVVHLNALSSVRATMTPWSRRLQLLQGQASFEVAQDPRRLQVYAGRLRVEDIGTTFDIALYRQQARIEVTEGRVHVWRDDRKQQPMLADLGAGQSARIDAVSGRVDVSNEDVAAMHAWWQRRIVFRDAPLTTVAEDFNRLNRTRLLIDDAAAGALRLTGNLRGDDVASLRAFLDDQPNLRVVAAPGVLRVSSRPAQGAAAH
ncbi:FecR domain-containing protein [Xanthomonas sp. WHRI 10064A]|uniref:FecR family protein n=1 Tax=unclassified Xanthomonas TaxID=2643310 RepID=UPI002B22B4EC|nr:MULTISPECIES: FecR domain-containing protein [unclassified Xanthomonas]MEA9587506.1 FecR domain-containing protein [Xanthomonas sp. WHRI 10064B]MEA9615227.1 FecR domain-containing protein [Xanthomonas sp. WHRI 10064A]